MKELTSVCAPKVVAVVLDAEDAMLEAYKAGYEAADAVEFPEMQLGHMYRHPKKPGEVWAPPSRS